MRSLVGGAQPPPAPAPAAQVSANAPTQREIEEMMTKTLRKLFGELSRSDR
jgi:hypothetical protein